MQPNHTTPRFEETADVPRDVVVPVALRFETPTDEDNAMDCNIESTFAMSKDGVLFRLDYILPNVWKISRGVEDGNWRKVFKGGLEDANWNQSAAARVLKVSRDHLRYRIKKHNLQRRHHG